MIARVCLLRPREVAPLARYSDTVGQGEPKPQLCAAISRSDRIRVELTRTDAAQGCRLALQGSDETGVQRAHAANLRE